MAPSFSFVMEYWAGNSEYDPQTGSVFALLDLYGGFLLQIYLDDMEN